MTVTTNFFGRIVAVATAAALSLVMIASTVATPSAPMAAVANTSVMA